MTRRQSPHRQRTKSTPSCPLASRDAAGSLCFVDSLTEYGCVCLGASIYGEGASQYVRIQPIANTMVIAIAPASTSNSIGPRNQPSRKAARPATATKSVRFNFCRAAVADITVKKWVWLIGNDSPAARTAGKIEDIQDDWRTGDSL